MEKIFTAADLSKEYGGFSALSNLSINVEKGAIYGLIGKNGAGKTTLIRLLCGLQEPTGGEFALFGARSGTRDIYLARRKIGALIETPAIYNDMTVFDNLSQQAKLLGVKGHERIDEVLALLGLKDAEKKNAGRLSLGMRQRLAIAIALLSQPEFLILDEPMNGLDPQGIIELRELLLRLNREKGTTILISSHILDELAKIATHYGFIDNGKMVKEISSEELQNQRKKRTVVVVNETAVLLAVLRELGLKYSLKDSAVEIFGNFDLSRLIALLSERGCLIKEIKEKTESLEDYYIDLVGGEKQ